MALRFVRDLSISGQLQRKDTCLQRGTLPNGIWILPPGQQRHRVEPGEYFVSLAFVGCSEKSRKEWEEQSSWTGKKYMEAIIRNELLFPLYFKYSYTRNMVMGDISRCGLNMGLSVTGTECNY